MRRNRRTRRVHRFDVELETLTTLKTLRERRDDAGQLDRFRFPRHGQLIGQPPARQCAGPGETECSNSSHEDDLRDPRLPE